MSELWDESENRIANFHPIVKCASLQLYTLFVIFQVDLSLSLVNCMHYLWYFNYISLSRQCRSRQRSNCISFSSFVLAQTLVLQFCRTDVWHWLWSMWLMSFVSLIMILSVIQEIDVCYITTITSHDIDCDSSVWCLSRNWDRNSWLEFVYFYCVLFTVTISFQFSIKFASAFYLQYDC